MKTALITGASMGFGERFVRLLAKENYRIIMVARSEDKMKNIADELNCQTRIIAMDLSESDAAGKLAELVADEDIDMLVNNAGFGDYGHFEELSKDKMISMMKLNMLTLTELCYLIMPKMKKGSEVLNVASMAAFSGGAFFSVYAATKAYVLTLSEGLYEEYKGKIMVTALCPGPTATSFGKTANMDDTALFRYIPSPTPDMVAEYGLKKLRNKRPVAIPGLSNQLMYLGSKLLPRAVSRSAITLSRSLNRRDHR